MLHSTASETEFRTDRNWLWVFARLSSPYALGVSLFSLPDGQDCSKMDGVFCGAGRSRPKQGIFSARHSNGNPCGTRSSAIPAEAQHREDYGQQSCRLTVIWAPFQLQ